ncbi:DUF305 domain-containing protein [Actinophytocola sp.]|uniref:DUF305 domain-containing protein n=1 Tax=Actinophytocola sp. TaxID=1872138 RepID=UPI002ED4932E
MRKYLTVAAALVAFTAAGCGGGDDTAGSHESMSATATATSESASAEHNDQDVAFAQGMIPHHQQAVDMAKAAAEKATNPAVKALAGRVQGAQDPEIQRLTEMLESWGAPTEPSGMPGMDHGSGGDGMMTDDQMAELDQASGAEFDQMWLQMMIEHHQGAVTMAKTELESGSDADAKALAQQIVDAQEAEITEMQGMLA